MLESTYDEIIANPTARESGTNSWRPTPTMNSAGMNTESTHSMERKRGVIVFRQASTTARAFDIPEPRCVWMFSISTVASSTNTPTANARPPSVMMLIVCPVSHSATTAERIENGIVMTTISELRRSRRKISTISPVKSAPRSASPIKPLIAPDTYLD